MGHTNNVFDAYMEQSSERMYTHLSYALMAKDHIAVTPFNCGHGLV
jgi:hypothetical protein